ncbi:MAG: MFS transporter [Caulobacteraceae bacterium]
MSDARLDESERASQLKRAVLAGTIGAVIEWYDFFLYSVVTGLVFAKLYFPQSDHLTGTLQAFAIYGVGFVARPFGAFIFGHYGDRIGRKATLIATLTLMGVATVAVAFVPTYSQIGIWGAVILVFLRFVQGIGVGGEWSGGVLLAMEWAKSHNRGLVSAWPQFGSPAGLFLANGAVWICSVASGDAFLDWGWRIPFLISFVLILVGLYIRVGVKETPAFTKLIEEKKLERAPVRVVIKGHWKLMLWIILSRMVELTPYYIFTSYIFSYGTTNLGLPRDLLLVAVMAASALSWFTIPFAGWLSDRFGRKRIFMIGGVWIVLYGFLYFAMLDTRNPALVIAAIVLSLIPHDLMWGAFGAFVSENFPARLRYSGASISTQLGSVLPGGLAPIIAAYLTVHYGSGYSVAIFLALAGVVGLVAALQLKDYAGQQHMAGDEADSVLES